MGRQIAGIGMENQYDSKSSHLVIKTRAALLTEGLHHLFAKDLGLRGEIRLSNA
jgi:hypothetical protein